jgi:hypothetical protein
MQVTSDPDLPDASVRTTAGRPSAVIEISTPPIRDRLAGIQGRSGAIE